MKLLKLNIIAIKFIFFLITSINIKIIAYLLVICICIHLSWRLIRYILFLSAYFCKDNWFLPADHPLYLHYQERQLVIVYQIFLCFTYFKFSLSFILMKCSFCLRNFVFTINFHSFSKPPFDIFVCHLLLKLYIQSANNLCTLWRFFILLWLCNLERRACLFYFFYFFHLNLFNIL